MEIIPTRAKFYGDGGKYFSILLVNALLIILTLGIYYPWARAKTLQYLYGETEFAGSRFAFHGTGKEMFRGFIKAVIIIVALLIINAVFQVGHNPGMVFIGALIYMLGILLIIPLAIHGSLRYRMSRTTWRGINLGYRGNLRELLGIYFKGIFLTIITLGIYGSWFSVNMRKYVTDHVRLGNVKLNFKGTGSDLFLVNLSGIFLSIITLGIYTFWWVRNLNHFHINNMSLEQDGQEFQFNSQLGAGDIFVVGITNYFLILFTLGIGTPWALLRNMRMVIDNVELQGAFNAETVVQTEDIYTDATGDDLLSMLDIGLDF
ncbi:MAG TPA: DUF898 family protein [Chitinophagales bacterium]|nr:DUF898 family protein [Chitinophagales bacterium]